MRGWRRKGAGLEGLEGGPVWQERSGQGNVGVLRMKRARRPACWGSRAGGEEQSFDLGHLQAPSVGGTVGLNPKLEGVGPVTALISWA